jgi:aspartyl-tRNA(Asn)/glutamyl-tRNA(Gln) amidotransferase subunit A
MIRELHEKLINGETTSVKLTEEYFDRIEKKDKDLNAYLTLTRDLALEQAKKVDKKIKNGEEIGLLEGIPGAIKDNICIDGIRTTSASKILDNYIAPYNATVIEKLKENGAVMLGKTNMDEFAMGSSTENSAYGPTKNPHDFSRVPGGTSGGFRIGHRRIYPPAGIALRSSGTQTDLRTSFPIRSNCDVVQFRSNRITG